MLLFGSWKISLTFLLLFKLPPKESELKLFSSKEKLGMKSDFPISFGFSVLSGKQGNSVDDNSTAGIFRACRFDDG